MKNFEQGVNFYTKGTIEIFFPEGLQVCRWCPGLIYDYKLERTKCLFSGEIIEAPDYMQGQFCKINFKEKEE